VLSAILKTYKTLNINYLYLKVPQIKIVALFYGKIDNLKELVSATGGLLKDTKNWGD
jgi:hypothetical protein